MTDVASPATSATRSYRPLALVLLAAAGTFALTMGARQSMGLFVSALNTHTGVGFAAVSLAFAFGQLWWGLTQPLAGIVADRVGPGRVLVVGVLLVALGTWLIPRMHSTVGLVVAIGVLAAGGAGMAGPAVLMAAVTRLVEPARRGFATGVVNAGGSLGQFIFAPLAQTITSAAGWMASVSSKRQGSTAVMRAPRAVTPPDQLVGAVSPCPSSTRTAVAAEAGWRVARARRRAALAREARR